MLLLKGYHQLLVVITQGWEEKEGKLTLYERKNDDSAWTAINPPIQVILGKNGLAWGIGLHPGNTEMHYKKEGDGKSPAGIFSLGIAFGFAPRSEMGQLKIKYLPLHQFIEAVDDPLSCYYNCILDRRDVVPDWRSSEKMSEEHLYALGLNVHHNFPNPQANAGSAIFLHIWRGTAGCTAMSESDLSRILFWLDQEKNPALIQLPINEYHVLQNQ